MPIDCGAETTARTAKHTAPVSKSLKPCPDCGESVSKSALFCPHCGRHKLGWIWFLLSWLALIALIAVALPFAFGALQSFGILR
ncbi:MAG: zinc-ribbon domain-containing protein [Lentisphaeria bacterium]|nr:zinc-ribbon domain-containing protein [Lentisphaeria bacterium]